jgi:hypothetical protein
MTPQIRNVTGIYRTIIQHNTTTTEHELENPARYQSRSIRNVLGSNLRWDPKCPDNLRSFTQSLKEIPGPHLGTQSNVAPPTAPLLEGRARQW